jgi:peptidoglycan hydrolase CwlO-like protein
VDLNFREATLFIDWIQQAIGPLGKEPSLPAVPDSLRGVAREWAGVIDRLNQQFLESEEDRTDAQRNLQSAENMVDSLTKELGTVKGESESAQKTCSDLEKKVKQLEESLADFSRVSKERDRLVSKVSTMQSELQNKGAELESVSMTLKSLSNAIRNLLPSDPN